MVYFVSFVVNPLTAFLAMELIRNLVFDEFDEARLVAEHPGDDLPRVREAFRFDDCPSRMISIFTPPFEAVQVPCGVDLFDCPFTILNRVRRFDQVTFHLIPLNNNISDINDKVY